MLRILFNLMEGVIHYLDLTELNQRSEYHKNLTLVSISTNKQSHHIDIMYTHQKHNQRKGIKSNL